MFPSRPRPVLALMETTVAVLQGLHRRLGRKTDRTPAQERGLQGERAAYFYLRKAGYIVVARRWRHAPTDGEVDLIAWEGETLCFLEVKTRSSRTPFAAEFSVDARKADALRRMSDAYIRLLPWGDNQPPALAVRFDVVSVYLAGDSSPDVRLLRDFFR